MGLHAIMPNTPKSLLRKATCLAVYAPSSRIVEVGGAR
jgi:hypothetical protein